MSAVKPSSHPDSKRNPGELNPQGPWLLPLYSNLTTLSTCQHEENSRIAMSNYLYGLHQNM